MNFRKKALQSQEKLKTIQIYENNMITKAKFGPSKETRIPFFLDETLAFFVATIIGDGHLRKSKLQISMELSNKNILEYVKDVCFKLFDRKFTISPVKLREGRKQTHQFCADSKAIYSLLNHVFEIPIGNKSNIVYVSEIIKKSNRSIKSAFLIGIMLTEGGNRRRGVGMSTSSKKLWEDLIQLFNEIGISVFTDRWIYKKYNKEYYGFYFKKSQIQLITNACKNNELCDLFLKNLFI